MLFLGVALALFGPVALHGQNLALKLGFNQAFEAQILVSLAAECAIAELWSLQGDLGVGARSYGSTPNIVGLDQSYFATLEVRRYLFGQRGQRMSGAFVGPSIQASRWIWRRENLLPALQEGHYLAGGAVVGYQYALGERVRLGASFYAWYAPINEVRIAEYPNSVLYDAIYNVGEFKAALRLSAGVTL